MISLQKPRSERRRLAGSSSAKKAKVASEAESAASEITVSLNPKLLKCSACCGTLVPPLFQCDNGHITCFECCKNLVFECSLCGERNDTRCRSVEHILGGMTVPCSFKEHGCTDMVQFMEKAAHEETCIHAPCYCPIAGCGPYARLNLCDHINLQHPTISYTSVVAGNLWPLKIRDGEPARLVSLANNGALFLLVVDRNVPSGCALSVIHLKSEPVREDDFKYKIQVYTQTGILCLSGETQSVGHLMRPYQAGASLFVSDAMWSPQDSPVYIELKK
ncbi:unnamed protein product [Alopecurus aequalis]